MDWSYDHHEFFKRVGVIFDIDRLAELGLDADSPTGIFDLESLEAIRDFCAKDPTYHIVSYVGPYCYVNRYDERGLSFRLADRDANPNLALSAKGVRAEVLPLLQKLFKIRRHLA